MTRIRLLRAALGAVGIGFGLWGLRLLLQSLTTDALIRLPLWLGGAVLADDFFLIPLTVAAGWFLTRWSIGPDHHRTVTTVRTTLLYAGITTLVAIPLLLRQGKGINPTVLPRNYLLDWLLLEATILLTGALIVLLRIHLPLRGRAESPVAEYGSPGSVVEVEEGAGLVGGHRGALGESGESGGSFDQLGVVSDGPTLGESESVLHTDPEVAAPGEGGECHGESGPADTGG